MPMRKSLLLAMLLTTVVLAAFGWANYKLKSNVPIPNTQLRLPMPAATASSWYGSYPASAPDREVKSFHSKGELLPALFVPIQFKNPGDLSVGKLLVASRGLGDPNFAETVILLIQFDDKGVLGLILNRRTDVPISRVFKSNAAKDRSDPVYLGGPVEISAVFSLVQSSVKLEKAENIFGGVYLISDKGLFERTLSERPDPSIFHVYLGYAGWTQDQLRAEVQSGAWFVLPAEADAVFNSDPDSLWLQMIRKTELKWAKNESFAVNIMPVALFR